MILLAIGLLVVGIFLSAFFSGSETGFYRASRVRLVLDALEGDRISRFLVALTNNPTYFVATTLVGNNVANYLTSLAIVLLTRSISVSDSSTAEMVAPIFFGPVLFVYGELMPKNLFYNAPNRLLRRGGPLIAFFSIVFAPVAGVLWVLALGMERILGQSPSKVRLVLARKELEDVLEEGQAAGILHPTQRHLAQNFYLYAARTVGQLHKPLGQAPMISRGTTYESAIAFARRRRLPDIPVYDGQRTNIIGFVRTIDLLLAQNPKQTIDIVHKIESVSVNEKFGEILLQMQSNREAIRKVTDEQGRTIGLLWLEDLVNLLLDGPLGALKR